MIHKFLHLTYSDLDAVPITHLVQLASEGKWINIMIEARARVLSGGILADKSATRKSQWIKHLATLLPEHFIRDGGFSEGLSTYSEARSRTEGTTVKGMSRILIWRYRPEDVERIVDENLDLFVTLMVMYRSLANQLIRRLALQFDVDVAQFSASSFLFPCMSTGALGGRQSGKLHDDGYGNKWNYYFHGHDCAFSNRELSMYIEVRLGHATESGDDFGVIEQNFFARFVGNYALKYTEVMPIAQVLHDSKNTKVSNAQIALTYLQHLGFLRVTRLNQGIGWDWVVIDKYIPGDKNTDHQE